MEFSHFNRATESKRRSLAKAVSWRLVGLVMLGTITYFVTRSWEATGGITVVYHLLQVFLYFGHERVWERIRWGKPNSLEQLPPARELTTRELDVITAHLRELGYIE